MKKKILIVEDAPEMQNMFKLDLESEGYEVILAGDGQEGLAMAKEKSPHIIITDVLMPVMDGFAFYKELKDDMKTAKIPVLILTARGQMKDSFIVVGADDFLAKPFDPKELHRKIKVLISKREESDSLDENVHRLDDFLSD